LPQRFVFKDIKFELVLKELSTAYTECCVPCHVNERNVEDDIDQTRYLDIKEDVELFGR